MNRWARYIMIIGLGWLIGCLLNDELDRIQIGIGIVLIFIAMVLWEIAHRQVVNEVDRTRLQSRYIEGVLENMGVKIQRDRCELL